LIALVLLKEVFVDALIDLVFDLHALRGGKFIVVFWFFLIVFKVSDDLLIYLISFFAGLFFKLWRVFFLVLYLLFSVLITFIVFCLS
jgi:hypothetical protein